LQSISSINFLVSFERGGAAPQVKRIFAWLTGNRRLGRKYERNPALIEAVFYIASSRLIFKHLSS
jgi:hypothetical protein